jgi:hypothetical protein
VHKEEDVLITCKGEPILIGKRNEHGRYRIPLVQQRGQWQPQKPKREQEKLSMKLIVCMIFRPLSKQSNGCMQCADSDETLKGHMNQTRKNVRGALLMIS